MTSLPTLPALVNGTVSHRRTGSVPHSFRYRIYQWLVDLDDMPRLPAALRPFASFRSSDHVGDPTKSIKANVVGFLATHDIDLGDECRVVMLTHPRVLGYVFNPLSVFWCYDEADRLTCIVAEVHNTYGEQHAYLLRPDPAGSAVVDKELYVSPFFDVSGQYELRLLLEQDSVACRVTLRRAGEVAFTGSFVGRPEPVSIRRVLRAIVRQPLMPQRVTALIRLQGIRLWLRRLPVQTRPT